MSTQSTKINFLLAAGPLFLILFIDGMGLGLVFPILNALIMDPAGGFLAHNISIDARNLIFGCTIGLFMFCWFFGAAFLGDLSDQIGRKKSLMICLLGACLGYILSALAVVFDSFVMLLLGRLIAGFTAGSQPIAQAVIVDLSPPEHKARNLGLILFAVSLGFILGPLLGGFLSDHILFSWFNFATPFYFAAIISFLNAILLWFLFHETFVQRGKIQIKLHRAIGIFISAFRNEQVRSLSIVLLIFIFGWSSFYSFISMFLLRVYGFTPLAVGIFMAAMGAGFCIGTGFLVDYCTLRFPLKNCVIVGAFATAICTLITVVMHHAIFAWLAIVPLAAAVAVAYSAILTMFSNQVDANSQGWVMGITGAIMAFAFGINGVLLGALADFSPNLPLIVAAVSLALSAVTMFLFHNSHSAPKREPSATIIH